MYGCKYAVSLYKIVFVYHIPLFVFISGFCFLVSKKTIRNGIVKSICDKFRGLIIPAFVVCLLIVIPTEVFITHITSYTDILNRIGDILKGYNVAHLWFLFMLFWIFVLFIPLRCFIEKLQINKIRNICWYIIFAFTVFAFLNSNKFLNVSFCYINQVLKYAYFFALGICLAINREKLNDWILKNRLTVITICGLMICSAISYILINWETYIGAWFITTHLYSFLGISTIFILVLYSGCVLISNAIKKVPKEILFIERESRIIYYIHIMFGEVANLIMPYIGKLLNLTPTNMFLFTFMWMLGMACLFSFIYEKIKKKVKDVITVNYCKSAAMNSNSN